MKLCIISDEIPVPRGTAILESICFDISFSFTADVIGFEISKWIFFSGILRELRKEYTRGKHKN